MIAGEIEIRLMAEISRLRTDMERARRNVEETTGAMARAANMAKNALAAIGGALSLVALTQQVVGAQREFDKLHSSLVTVTGSTAGAGEAFAALQKFAASTPFSLQEVTEGFLKLRNLGLTPSQAALTSYGNTAAAMGKSLNQLIEAVADAATGEFERLKEFGIKAKQQGDQVALTFQGTTTTIGNNATEIEAYLKAIGDVNFAGGMERQAATLDGALSNLGDTWSQTLVAFSQSGFGEVVHGAVLALTGSLSDLSAMFKAVTRAADAEGKKVEEIGPLHSALTTIFETIMVLGTNVSYVLTTIGRDIGAMAAQAVAAATFDFDSVRRIGEMRVADAKREREEVDRKTAAILGAAAAAKAAREKEAAEEKAGTEDKLARYKIQGNAAAQLSDKEAKEAAKRIQAAAKFIEGQRRELEAIGKTEDEQRKLTAARAAAAAPTAAQRREIMSLADAITAESKAWSDSEAARKAAEDAIGANAETMLQLQERARGLELEIELHGKTAEAAVMAEAARVRATASSMAISEDYRAELIAQAEQLERIAGLQGKKDALDVSSKAAKQAAEDWRRAAESIEQSLTDALLRGFESGKSFGRNLVDTLKNMFQTLILRPTIQGIMAPVSGALAGSLGMAGPVQAAGGGSGIGSAVGSGLGIGGTLATIGTGAMQTAGAIISGQIGLGTTLSAGLGAIGTGTASGIMAGLSSVVGALGPIALGVGAVAMILKKGFSMGPKEVTATTLNGSFGANGFMGTTDSAWKKEGGWFRSDKTGVDKVAVDAAMSKELGSVYEAIKASSADFAKVLGINADAIKDRAQSMSIALTKDEEANKKAIAEFFVGVGNTIAGELLPSLSQFQQEGEQASATLQRLATGYALVDTALTSIGMSFGAVGTSSLEARERLLAAAGGLEAFAANTAGFQQNFLTEAERNAPVLKSVTEQLAALGLAGVDTRDEFKQVVLGLDLTTEAGAKQYGSLMKLQAAFAQVYPSIDQTAIAAEKAAKLMQERAGLQDQLDELTMTSAQLLEKQRNALDESNRALFDQIQAVKAQKTAAEQVAEFWRDQMASVAQAQAEAERQRQAAISQAMESSAAAQRDLLASFASGIDKAKEMARSLRDLADSMKLGDLSSLSAGAQYNLALQQLQTASPENIQAAANTFLKASKDRDEGSLAYARDFAMVQQLIERAASAKDQQARDIEWIGMLVRDSMRLDGSHANGLDYVPFDGYRAELHRGERVQTAAEVRGGDATAAAVERLAVVVERQGDALDRTARDVKRVADGLEMVTNGWDGMRNSPYE